MASDTLSGYEGAAAIGPITDAGGIGFPACGSPPNDPCVHTTLGLLSFSANLSPTSLTDQQATFDATIEPAPEPSYRGLLAVLLGLAAGCSVFKSRALESGK